MLILRVGGAAVIGLLVFAGWPGRAIAQPSDELPAVAAGSARGGLPPNIRVPREIRQRIETMLERSATFRDQCRRLADAPWLHVLVRQMVDFEPRSIRAHSTIQRPQPQLVLAIVDRAASADPAMWLSHEFEHLIEQIDGIDLTKLVDDPLQAWQVRTGMFETNRAIRAGEAVFDEVQIKRHHDKFVD